MLISAQQIKKAKIMCCLMMIMAIGSASNHAENTANGMSNNMVLVKGGAFEMGDVFGEGLDNEKPVHKVTLSDFYISKYEVTVAQFRKFIKETGYRTSAEGPNDAKARGEIMTRFTSGDLSRQEMQELRNRLLDYSGAGYWDAAKCVWTGYNPLTTWKNPGFKQTDSDPVMAVSPDDAMRFCNWLSKMAGLPVAYDLETGNIIDKYGNPTPDVTAVEGFRLPTEAEWEYAAREGGKKVRFGNGKNTARSSEINFRANAGEFDYLETGDYAAGTKPVGSYPPNSLGLYDMSGNAWEWVSDKFASYTSDSQTDPYCTNSKGHALRGGRWGGDASEARVSSRSPWPRNDRCNNSGFRIAKSK